MPSHRPRGGKAASNRRGRFHEGSATTQEVPTLATSCWRRCVAAPEFARDRWIDGNSLLEPARRRCSVSLRSTSRQASPVTGDSSEAAQPDDDVRRTDELASRLAYEWNLRLAEDALRTLEAQRTRAVALLSVAIVALGIATSGASARGADTGLQFLGILGWILFGLGIAAVAVCAAAVAWPIETDALLDPTKIISNYVELRDDRKTPAWVHQKLSRDLRDGYARGMCANRRNRHFADLRLRGAIPDSSTFSCE